MYRRATLPEHRVTNLLTRSSPTCSVALYKSQNISGMITFLLSHSNTHIVKRRRFLAVSAVAATGATAGCNGILDDTAGNNVEDDEPDTDGVSALDADAILELMHAPGEFQDADHYSFSLSAPAKIDAMQGEIDDEAFTRLVRRARTPVSTVRRGLMDTVGVDFWNVGTHYSAGPVTALVGDFGREDVWRRLQYEGLQYQGDYNGFALIKPPDGDGQLTIAIEGEGRIDAEDAPSDISRLYIGEASQNTDSTTAVQTVIDVADGIGQRYSQSIEAVDSLVDKISDGAIMSGETFEAVRPEEGPSANLDHESIPLGQEVSSTLTADTTASIGENQFQYMERYGFAGEEEVRTRISVSAATNGRIGVVLHSGNGTERVIGSDRSQGQAEVTAMLPEGGPYNFVVYDPDQIESPRGEPREYTVEVTIEGGSIGGPESGVFEGEVARGMSLRFEEDEAIRQWVLVFEDGPPTGDIETWIDENSDEGERFGQYDEVTQQQEGDRATVEATFPISDLGDVPL